MFYVYVLECSDGTLYFGSTNDLKRRLSEHQAGKVKTTKSRSCTLVYYEAYRAESDARRREHQIKHYGQVWRQLKNRLKDSRQQEC